MNKFGAIILFLFSCLAPGELLGSEALTLGGCVRDQFEGPIQGIKVRAYRQGRLVGEDVTKSDGSYAIRIEHGVNIQDLRYSGAGWLPWSTGPLSGSLDQNINKVLYRPESAPVNFDYLTALESFRRLAQAGLAEGEIADLRSTLSSFLVPARYAALAAEILSELSQQRTSRHVSFEEDEDSPVDFYVDPFALRAKRYFQILEDYYEFDLYRHELCVRHRIGGTSCADYSSLASKYFWRKPESWQVPDSLGTYLAYAWYDPFVEDGLDVDSFVDSFEVGISSGVGISLSRGYLRGVAGRDVLSPRALRLGVGFRF